MLSIGGIWYRLFHLTGVGNKTLWQAGDDIDLLSLRGDFALDAHVFGDSVLAAHLTHIRRLYQSAFYARAEAELGRQNICIYHPHSALNPMLDIRRQVAHLQAQLPAVWFAYGRLAFQAPRVAIIGGREAPPAWLLAAEQLAERLAASGHIVVSGYAKGVDRSAHMGALNALGSTWMVLPYGLKHAYKQHEQPQLHRHMQAQLQFPDTAHQQCSWISQFPVQKGWGDGQGLQRNMSICALAHAIIVVWAHNEANKMSGSYQAARMAQSLNKPLFVLAPPAGESMSSGCQQLLDEGYAKCKTAQELSRAPWPHPKPPT